MHVTKLLHVHDRYGSTKRGTTDCLNNCPLQMMLTVWYPKLSGIPFHVTWTPIYRWQCLQFPSQLHMTVKFMALRTLLSMPFLFVPKYKCTQKGISQVEYLLQFTLNNTAGWVTQNPLPSLQNQLEMWQKSQFLYCLGIVKRFQNKTSYL